ncbi:hypothetical protein PC129_g13159 [Phytophthora cactorum]|uniref:Uncharacterized protein n=1 Tax=Phytophthora cactorum TaxID=29920 RepID=A0A329RWU9_9STRA|nr:hypothetical protein Pcac1_g17814 [Phytophthora cactorum]KAG2817277.1 hypothetical protein PC111_g12768 [Phytophthora cactorum]KAG2841793.1 hypothetical protein PC112_g3228 [Phytophthora cactorum]KAG2858555.1 hypothetical protein PC113_g9718 [Phytophthora cactorum]KAG2909959.1 hypothetical protein PC115_g13091 [Phytophthora cactorum]
MGSLLRQLQQCCRNESEKAHDFVITPKATDDLHRRSKEMERKSLLQDANVPEDEEVFASNPVVNVLSVPAERIYIQSKNRTEEALAITAQMGVNYARMEFEGMPNSG